MARSLESNRPLMHNNAPNRLSLLSTSTSASNSTLQNAFLELEEGFRRLDDARLQKQRFVPSEQKSEMISKLALGAKLERALRWRMSGQDAVLRRKKAQSVSLPVGGTLGRVDEKKVVV